MRFIHCKLPMSIDHAPTITMSLHSSPSQTLTVLHPTSSTVSFTVSTRPVPKTLTAILGFYLSIFVRCLAGTIILVVLWAKWQIGPRNSTDAFLWVVGDASEAWLLKSVEPLQWRYLAPGAVFVFWFVFRRGYTGKFSFYFVQRIYN